MSGLSPANKLALLCSCSFQMCFVVTVAHTESVRALGVDQCPYQRVLGSCGIRLVGPICQACMRLSCLHHLPLTNLASATHLNIDAVSKLLGRSALSVAKVGGNTLKAKIHKESLYIAVVSSQNSSHFVHVWRNKLLTTTIPSPSPSPHHNQTQPTPLHP